MRRTNGRPKFCHPAMNLSILDAGILIMALWVESDFEFAPCDLGTSRDLKISINYERYMM